MQFSSFPQSCPTLDNPVDCSMPRFPVHHQLPELAQTNVHPVSDVIQPLILYCPLLLLPSIIPSIMVFSNELALRIKWPKYWSFIFSISPSNEHPGLISFRMDWLDLPAVQGTLKNLLQHHSSNTSIVLCSALFIVQLSHPYMTTGKNHSYDLMDLCQQSYISLFFFLLFNMLFRLAIAFLPRRKCLLISWLQSPSAVILEPKKIVSHCFHCLPIYLPWSDGNRGYDISFLNADF